MTKQQNLEATDPPQESCINLKLNQEEEWIVKIDENGFHYKGQLIEDAGRAHQLLMIFLENSVADWVVDRCAPTDNELMTFIDEEAPGFHLCSTSEQADLLANAMQTFLKRALQKYARRYAKGLEQDPSYAME